MVFNLLCMPCFAAVGAMKRELKTWKELGKAVGVQMLTAYVVSLSLIHILFAPVAPVVELADSILAQDGCLNFFAGPSNPEFSAKFNFYNVHYSGTHVVGTSGGNTDDMKECLTMIGEKKLEPAILVTHIGGLDVARETTLNLPHVPGGKKLIYTHISLPLTAIADFEEKGKTDPLFAKLAELVAKTNGLWNAEAEKYLLENAPAI